MAPERDPGPRGPGPLFESFYAGFHEGVLDAILPSLEFRVRLIEMPPRSSASPSARIGLPFSLPRALQELGWGSPLRV
jgi:hypothetical protein